MKIIIGQSIERLTILILMCLINFFFFQPLPFQEISKFGREEREVMHEGNSGKSERARHCHLRRHVITFFIVISHTFFIFSFQRPPPHFIPPLNFDETGNSTNPEDDRILLCVLVRTYPNQRESLITMLSSFVSQVN